MDVAAFKDLTLKLLAIADRMEQRDERFVELLTQHVAQLQSATQAVSSGGQALARDALDMLRSQARDAVADSIAEAANASKTHLEASASSASWSAREVNEAAMELRKQRGLWLWAAPIALIAGALLTAGGSSFLLWKNAKELKRAEFGQDVLRATQSGALTQCGEALCAKVGMEPKRFGKQGEYVLLQD
jgi:hypothetical protein